MKTSRRRPTARLFRRLSPSIRSTPVLLLAATLLLVGCSDDDGTGDDGDSPQDAGADAVEMDAEPRPDGTDAAGDAESDAEADATADGGDAGDSGGSAYDLDLEGLSAPVTVQFDESGVLHVDCQTNLDCYTAQGYFHADHRFFEMDLVRRQTRGELSSVIGHEFGLDSDKTYRHMMTTRDGEPLEEAYVEAVDEETGQMLDAYAQGVNGWLDDMRNEENGADLSQEYDFIANIANGLEIRDWEPEDTAALYLQLAYQLSLSSDDDLMRGEVMGRLGLDFAGDTLSDEVAADLFTPKPGIESNIMDASQMQVSSAGPVDRSGPYPPQAVGELRERLAPATEAIRRARQKLDSAPSLLFGPRSGDDGSNNWVLGGSRTDSGRPLLANDPHLTLNNPAIWHYVELDSKTNGEGDLHVAGASIPSVPGIVAGQNEDVAWGVTTARLDLADAYVETLSEDGEAVMRDGSRVEILEKDYTIDGLDGATETVTFEWVPDHGPIISKDAENNRAISIKWVAHGAGNDIDFLQDLMPAESVDEAMAAMEPVRTINQSWVFMGGDAGEDESEIGWYPQGALPDRPWADAETPNWLPLPGDGSAEWQGFVSNEDHPKMTDPPAGFVATANNDFDGSYTDGDATDDGHTPWQHPPATGHRHARIVEMIQQEGDAHTPETMHAIQADTHSLHGEQLVPEIVTVADANTDDLSDGARDVVDALEAWSYTCPTGLDGLDPTDADKASDETEATESIGCSAFHVMLPALAEATFSDELAALESYPAKPNWRRLQTALLYLFTAPSQLNLGTDYFDDTTTPDTTETKDDIVVEALEQTATDLESVFDSTTPDEWRWGRTHTVTFASLASQQAGFDLSMFNEGPYANDGGLWTVDVANPVGRDGSFHHPHGPSLRMVFEAREDEIQGWFQLPGGQSHDRDSPFYQSLAEDWLTNTPRELLFDREEVDEAAVETLEVEPVRE